MVKEIILIGCWGSVIVSCLMKDSGMIPFYLACVAAFVSLIIF